MTVKLLDKGESKSLWNYTVAPGETTLNINF